MAATFEALARFVVRFRIAIVAVWAVVMVAAILALPGLGSESNSDPSLFLSSGARSVEAASLGTALLGSQDTSKITIVAARAGGPLTQPDLAAVAREARLAEQVSGVISARHLKGLAASGAGSISPDGRAVQFAVVVNHSSQDVAALRRVVNALEATFQGRGPGGPAAAPGRPGGDQRREQCQREQGDGEDRPVLDRVHPAAAAHRAAFAGGGAGHVRAQRGRAADGAAVHRRAGRARAADLLGHPDPAGRPDPRGGHRLRPVPGVPVPGGTAGRGRAARRGRGGPGPGRRVGHRLGRHGHPGAAHAAAGRLRAVPRPRHTAGCRRRGHAAGRADPAARAARPVRGPGVPGPAAGPRGAAGRRGRRLGPGGGGRGAPSLAHARRRRGDLRGAGPGHLRLPDGGPEPHDHGAGRIGRGRGQRDHRGALPAVDGQPGAPGPGIRRAGLAAPGRAGAGRREPARVGPVRPAGRPAQRQRRRAEPAGLRQRARASWAARRACRWPSPRA